MTVRQGNETIPEWMHRYTIGVPNPGIARDKAMNFDFGFDSGYIAEYSVWNMYVELKSSREILLGFIAGMAAAYVASEYKEACEGFKNYPAWFE